MSHRTMAISARMPQLDCDDADKKGEWRQHICVNVVEIIRVTQIVMLLFAMLVYVLQGIPMSSLKNKNMFKQSHINQPYVQGTGK